MSVYFARVKGYVKIGYSAKPFDRIGTITTGSCKKPTDVTYGDDVQLLGWIPGDRKVERAMHKQFAALNVVGEWFWDDDAYDELIAADEFSGTPHLSMDVIQLMEEYPTIPRIKIVEVCEQIRQQELAKPESDVSQAVSMIGDLSWVADWQERVDADNAADRAYWRSQRSAA